MNDLQSGQAERAKAALRRAFSRSPSDAKVAGALAHLHASLGEEDQAALFIERAATLEQNDIRPQWEAADYLHKLRRFRQAMPFYERCLKLSPRELAASEGLARCRMEMGDDAGMHEAYEAAIAASPERPQSYWLYMRSLKTLGRVDGAIAVLRRGMERLPGDKDLSEFMCTLVQFSDEYGAAAAQPHILAMHRGLAAANTTWPPNPAPSFTNSPDPERPIRVGLLSGDFCFHACAFFLVPVVWGLDPQRIPLVMFGTNPPDETTQNFARKGAYRDCSKLSDDDLAAAVRREGIDVLIECNGWTDRHRLPAVSRRLAPVQATYLGYPNTTGLDAMDWRIVDGITDPPEAGAWASERLLRLDGCFVCYGAPEAAPQPSPRTPAAGRPILFGSFNRLAKVTDATLRLWAGVLAAVPGSRLMLKSETYELSRQDTLRRFAIAGGDAARLGFLPFEPDPARHLAAYDRIDIALDTSPYNGTTTTCEAMVMGVPVVSLAGAAHRSRVGASLLHAVGLGELVAHSPAQYIEIAATLAGDAARLDGLHATLRERVLESSLCDQASFAIRLESGVRHIWREWCVSRSGATP